MNLDRKPLPRFWYLPRDEKAAVVMTGDDHGNGGTAGRFDQYEAHSPAGLLGRRLGVRPRHLLHLPEHPDHRRRGRRATRPQGFEIGAARHAPTAPTGPPSAARIASTRASSRTGAPTIPSLRRPATNRTHCIAWSDWATQPKVELEQRHPARHELLLLAARRGSRTGPGCSPAPACRCASPTSTAR